MIPLVAVCFCILFDLDHETLRFHCRVVPAQNCFHASTLPPRQPICYWRAHVPVARPLSNHPSVAARSARARWLTAGCPCASCRDHRPATLELGNRLPLPGPIL